MMADNFTLNGTWATTPISGVGSFDPDLASPIQESLVLLHKEFQSLDLAVDTPVVVSFGGVASANIIVLKAQGGPVVATVTSAAGSAQTIPFDTYLIFMSMGTPITALSLTRAPATPTSVRVLLGEKA
jgi:hypothetical protein